MDSRDIAVISICAALWAILNALIAPIFWRLTRLPFFCDLLALVSLSIAMWWSRKLGVASLVGIVATLLNFILRPGALFFLGFTVASIALDVMGYSVGYERIFSSSRNLILLVILGAIAAWIAGLVIGTFFMGFNSYKAVLVFSLLHAIGGVIGTVISIPLIRALEARRLRG